MIYLVARYVSKAELSSVWFCLRNHFLSLLLQLPANKASVCVYVLQFVRDSVFVSGSVSTTE